MGLTEIHFIRPLVLLALPVVLFIIWLLIRNRTKDDGWAKICDPHLLDAIKIESAGKGSKWALLLYPISLITLIAIAGPAFRKLPTPVIKNQSALVIALDISRSMLADDIKPNRLERAKFKINDILSQRKDGQTALLVYAGDAFVVTPLTDDTDTIALMLKAISPDIMPEQGTRVDFALTKSQKLLKQAGYMRGDILLIGDGVNLSKTKSVVKELVSNTITTSVLAVGTIDGAPIPIQTGFVKDSAGNIVIPKLQVDDLSQLAANGNGRFAQLTGDTSDIDYLLPSVEDENNNEENNKDDAFDTEKYIDEGPWLALLLLPLVALLFRKGLLLSLFFVVGLQTPQSSYAIDWDSLWYNSDQQAAQQLQNGNAKNAFNMAKSDKWKATAAFRDKDYQQAQSLFDDGSADGYYNQGNALAASGKLKEAIESYENALKIRPDDEDTLYNKKQVEQALEQQEKQNQDKQDQDNKDQDNKDQDSQDQENKDQNQEQQNQKDGEGEQKESEENQQQDSQDNPDKQEKEQQSGEMTEEEKKKQEQEQKKLDQADKEAKEKQQEQEVKMSPKELAEEAENKEAIEQWLRRIPDDPGGLLRRKFYYQYKQQERVNDESEDW